MTEIPIMEKINSVGTTISTVIAIISICIAVKSFNFSITSNKERNDETEKEKVEYLLKVETILKIILDEIEQIITEEILELSNKTTMMKKRYIKKSNTYTVQQVKSRLHIICSFEFSTMDSKRLKDLYDIRTLVAGLYNTLYGFEKNLKDKNFKLEEYERYLKDILKAIKDVSDNSYIETLSDISNNKKAR